MKITSGSAAGAGTSKGYTTGAETAGFGAAGAAAGGRGRAGSSRSAITSEAGGGCAARRNLNTPFTELRRTGQEAAKTELFEARAARHYAWQHAGPAGRNLTDLILPVLRANYVCSENSYFVLRNEEHILGFADCLGVLLSVLFCESDERLSQF